MTPLLCAGICQGYAYMGVEFSSQCMCGNTLPVNNSKLADQECNTTCSGDPTQSCGGVWRLNLFLLH